MAKRLWPREKAVMRKAPRAAVRVSWRGKERSSKVVSAVSLKIVDERGRRCAE